MLRRLPVAALVLLAAALAFPAASPAAIAHLTRVASGFVHPVQIAQPRLGGGGRLFVVQQGGRIRIVLHGRILTRPFLDVSGRISSGGEQGLLSMAFHPNYARNGLFYVDYTDRNGDTRVVEFRRSGADPDVASPQPLRQVLFVNQPFANHNGGQLQFARDGRLYVGMGDGGGSDDPDDRAQNPASRLGKLLAIAHPASSPTVTRVALGLRNPWRFSFDSVTGDLWLGDVGQGAWEEVDHVPLAGLHDVNFGWDRYEGTHVHEATPLGPGRLVWPVAQYDHSAGRCSITGGYRYHGPVAGLRGWYIYADFCSGDVWRKRLGQPAVLMGMSGTAGSVSGFGVDLAGNLYVAGYARGVVYRVTAG